MGILLSMMARHKVTLEDRLEKLDHECMLAWNDLLSHGYYSKDHYSELTQAYNKVSEKRDKIRTKLGIV